MKISKKRLIKLYKSILEGDTDLAVREGGLARVKYPLSKQFKYLYEIRRKNPLEAHKNANAIIKKLLKELTTKYRKLIMLI